MIRPVQESDLPEILALLYWMDEHPQREVFTPLSRDAQELELEWECEQSEGWVLLSDMAEVVAYCGSAPFKDGLALEGPLGQGSPQQLLPLLQQVLQRAEGLPVYAFCAAQNAHVRAALEQAGLTPMHMTDFFEAPLQDIPVVPCPDGFDYDGPLELLEYRDLYHASEASWSERLQWTPEQYDEHFAREDILFLSLRRRGRSVGFIEAELQYELGRAEVSYLCVHPADRGQMLGQVLISLMVAELSQFPAIRRLRLRAHDHAHAARALYARLGLQLCRSMMTYMQEAEEEA